MRLKVLPENDFRTILSYDVLFEYLDELKEFHDSTTDLANKVITVLDEKKNEYVPNMMRAYAILAKGHMVKGEN